MLFKVIKLRYKIDLILSKEMFKIIRGTVLLHLPPM